MNPETGEVKRFNEFMPGEPRIRLEQEPDPNCLICRGKGSIPKATTKRKKRFKPCYCTYKDYVPIEKQHRDNMNDIGKMLGVYLDGAGFCLLVFDWNGTRMNYISNAERETMIEGIEEFLERVKKEIIEGGKS